MGVGRLLLGCRLSSEEPQYRGLVFVPLAAGLVGRDACLEVLLLLLL
jgi:hypothetical protein